MRARHGRRVAGVLLAYTVIAAGAAAPIAVVAHARRSTPPRVHIPKTASLAATTPPTLVPGATTTFVTVGTDKVLHITDTPGNGALLFINELQGHVGETPVVVDGTPQEPIYSDLTPGEITITSKDQISISTASYNGTPVCTYLYAGTRGMENDPEVLHHVVCQVETMSVALSGALKTTFFITSTNVDLGDGDDSVMVRADPIPKQEVVAVDSDSGIIPFQPVDPILEFNNDLMDWNVYGGAGNDWLDVNVTTREGENDSTDGIGVLDPDAYNMPWHTTSAYIHGGDDNDTITGGRGPDYLYGENGNDAIIDIGQAVSGTTDHLDGGPGNDTLDGRDGPDIITGGSGRDTISGSTGADTIYANDGEADVIACGGQTSDTIYSDALDTRYSC